MHLTCIPRAVIWATAWGFLANIYGSFAQAAYYGQPLGHLSSLHHGVSGEVFAVDTRTLHIRDFTYDGEGPAAYFYVGDTKTPSGPGGVRLNDEKGSTNPLPRYRKKHITLTLPEGKNLQNIRWFSVWCDEFAVNFGDVKIPKNLEIPTPQKLEGLRGIHGVSSEPIVIVDAQTLLLPSFSYDGEAPDAKFWVGRGSKPSSQGIRVSDENGKEVPLRRYDRKTIVLTLPSDLTVFDIGHFGVWCEAFAVDFGHVRIPRGLNVPPSLKMLGVSPQQRASHLQNFALPSDSTHHQRHFPSSHHGAAAGNNGGNNAGGEYLKPTTYRPPSFRGLHLPAASNIDIVRSITVHDQLAPLQQEPHFQLQQQQQQQHQQLHYQQQQQQQQQHQQQQQQQHFQLQQQQEQQYRQQQQFIPHHLQQQSLQQIPHHLQQQSPPPFPQHLQNQQHHLQQTSAAERRSFNHFPFHQQSGFNRF